MRSKAVSDACDCAESEREELQRKASALEESLSALRDEYKALLKEPEVNGKSQNGKRQPISDDSAVAEELLASLQMAVASLNLKNKS